MTDTTDTETRTLVTTAAELTSEQRETLAEMMAEEPTERTIDAAHALVFKTGSVYTSTALLAIIKAYEFDCDGGDGLAEVTAILRDAAERIAVIEAQVI